MNSIVWDKEGTLARFGNKQDMLERVLKKYLESAPSSIEAIAEGIAAGDADAVKVHAHTLKGMSATVGAVAVSELAASLEMHVTTLTTDERTQMLESIRGAQQDLQHLLDQ